MPMSSTTPTSFPLHWMLVLVDVLGGAFLVAVVAIGGMPRFLSGLPSAAVGERASLL